LNAVDICIVAVLAIDSIQLILQGLNVHFFAVCGTSSFTWVKDEITHVQFDVPSSEFVLLCLEFNEFFAVDDGTAAAATSPRKRRRTTTIYRLAERTPQRQYPTMSSPPLQNQDV
jgi:hypothetical protein